MQCTVIMLKHFWKISLLINLLISLLFLGFLITIALKSKVKLLCRFILFCEEFHPLINIEKIFPQIHVALYLCLVVQYSKKMTSAFLKEASCYIYKILLKGQEPWYLKIKIIYYCFWLSKAIKNKTSLLLTLICSKHCSDLEKNYSILIICM